VPIRLKLLTAFDDSYGRRKENDMEGKCACFFCNLKCPSCASLDVSLTIQPVLKAENRYEGFIQFRTVKVAKLTLECLACGKTFGARRKQMRVLVDFIQESLDYRIHSPKNRHEMIYVNPSGCVWFSDREGSRFLKDGERKSYSNENGITLEHPYRET